MWGSDIKRMLALCHDLVPLSKSQIIGPLYEQRAFAAVEASFMVRTAVASMLHILSSNANQPVQQTFCS